MQNGKDITPLDTAIVTDALSLIVTQKPGENSILYQLVRGNHIMTSGGIVQRQITKRPDEFSLVYSCSSNNAIEGFNKISSLFALAKGRTERPISLFGEDYLSPFFLENNGQALFTRQEVIYVPKEVKENTKEYARALEALKTVRLHEDCETSLESACEYCPRLMLEILRQNPHAVFSIYEPSKQDPPEHCAKRQIRECLGKQQSTQKRIVREPGLIDIEEHIIVDAISRDYLTIGEQSAGFIGALVRLNKAVQDYRASR